ncbi:unnamed protein product [Rotaria sp. Silwood2]|nr:unnamed protein product [Rotaria sp. Silwood2]
MAIKYYKKAINIELEYDEFDTSPSLEMTYSVLGEIYFEKDNLTNTLINLNKASEIGNNSTLFTLSNLIKVYIKKEHYTSALIYIH